MAKMAKILLGSDGVSSDETRSMFYSIGGTLFEENWGSLTATDPAEAAHKLDKDARFWRKEVEGLGDGAFACPDYPRRAYACEQCAAKIREIFKLPMPVPAAARG